MQRLVNPNGESFEHIREQFRWSIPERFNIGVAISDVWRAERPDKVALHCVNEAGERASYTFEQIAVMANQLANGLRQQGINKGDRVGVILPQRLETALAHIAIYKLGAVAVPLSVMFGPDALSYRLENCAAKVVITQESLLSPLRQVQDSLPELHKVLCVDAVETTALVESFWALLEGSDSEFVAVDTLAEDPALIIYTSGTTGPPKGALLAHRTLFGDLTGFEMSLNFFPQENDVFWTPADWAWTGGLRDGLLPSWYFGMPVVAYNYRKFDPEAALQLMQDYQVSTGFFPPTALKMLRTVPDIETRFDIPLRAVMSAGEAVGVELVHWMRSVFDIDINEMWGQTEHNYVVGNCSAVMPVKPGSIGKAYPGHEVIVVDDDGSPLPDGEVGELVAKCQDPVHLLGYWRNPEATEKKTVNGYWRTGDVGYRDRDGYLWLQGRADDVINSAGYRIGPQEIEDCLLKHAAVQQVAAVGVPDPQGIRGDIVKACIVLNPDWQPSDGLAKEIQASVKSRLAAYEYPRQVAFVESLPMTTTGKVRRIELREQAVREANQSTQ